MAKRRFEVKHDFIDAKTGATVTKYSVIEVDDNRIPALKKANVIGKEVKSKLEKTEKTSDSGGETDADDGEKS